MSRNFKILFFLLFTSIALSTYILFSMKNIVVQDDVELKVATKPIVDIQKVKEQYNKNIMDIILEIKKSINIQGDKKSKKVFSLEELKRKVENLKSPNTNYKNIHLNLILALNNFEDYLKSGDNIDKQRSLAFLGKAERDLNEIIKAEKNGI